MHLIEVQELRRLFYLYFLHHLCVIARHKTTLYHNYTLLEDFYLLKPNTFVCLDLTTKYARKKKQGTLSLALLHNLPVIARHEANLFLWQKVASYLGMTGTRKRLKDLIGGLWVTIFNQLKRKI